jgi:hypothetical protein
MRTGSGRAESEVSEVSALPDVTEELLAEAAVFLACDTGSAGFLDRFATVVMGDPWLASQALDRALAARALAGHGSVRIEPGDLRVETTSSGASLTACSVTAPSGGVAVSVRLVDADRRPVAGAALQVSTGRDGRVLVTNPAGWVHLTEPGNALHIQVGGVPEHHDDRHGIGSPEGASVIRLPRLSRPEDYVLAAAHEGVVHEAGEVGRWRLEAGGVEFLCLDRKGGYDLTVLLTDVTADFADRAVGAYAVRFQTWGRDGRVHRWMVPLAPSPLGLAGSLYSTDEDRLDPRSVEVRGAEQLIAVLGDHLDDVVRRSVRHSDALTAWDVLCRRLIPGRPRTVLEKALAERENLS